MTDTLDEWEKIVAICNPVFTVATGIVAYYFARNKNRKDITEDLIHEAVRNSAKLWMSCPKKPDNQQRSIELQADLTVIALKVSKRKKKKQAFKDSMKTFRQLATGDDFCHKDRQILKSNHSRIDQIKTAAENLCKAI